MSLLKVLTGSYCVYNKLITFLYNKLKKKAFVNPGILVLIKLCILNWNKVVRKNLKDTRKPQSTPFIIDLHVLIPLQFKHLMTWLCKQYIVHTWGALVCKGKGVLYHLLILRCKMYLPSSTYNFCIKQFFGNIYQVSWQIQKMIPFSKSIYFEICS